MVMENVPQPPIMVRVWDIVVVLAKFLLVSPQFAVCQVVFVSLEPHYSERGIIF